MVPEFHYATLENHIINFGRFALAFLIIFVFLPSKIFIKNSDSSMDNLVSGFMKMIVLLMVLGYLLVILKIFEAITLMVIFLLLYYYQYIRRNAISNVDELFLKIRVSVFDFIDGIINPFSQANNKIKENFLSKKEKLLKALKSPDILALGILFLLIFCYSAYLRFRDPMLNASLPLSDAYTVLAWTKHIGRNILFYPDGGGVYPRGLDFYLEILHKFSFVDTLYVLKYAGSLNSLLTVFGIYFALSRFTGKVFPALAAAFTYGVMGPFLHAEFTRQAATNSQELAFMFILPTLFFVHRYLHLRRKEDLTASFYGLCAAGLAHSLVLAYMGACMGVFLLISAIKGLKRNWNVIWKMSVAGISSVLVSLLPFIIGYVTNAPEHASSTEFLVSRISEISFPALSVADYAVLVGLAICLFFLVVFHIRKNGMEGEFSLMWIAAATFCAFYFAGLTRSTVIVTRIGEFWGLMQAVSIGLGLVPLSFMFETGVKRRLLFSCLCIVSAMALILICKPAPADPYKLERNTDTEQYIRISKNYMASTWMIASSWHKYALVFGKGFHIYMESLLKFDPATLKYSPAAGESELFWSDLQKNIFIFQPKNIYRVNDFYDTEVYTLEEEKTYKKQVVEKPLLEEWVKTYQQYHSNMRVFYEDENLRVLYIEKNDEDEKEKIWKQLWGFSGRWAS